MENSTISVVGKNERRTVVVQHGGQRLEVQRAQDGDLIIGLFGPDDINIENPVFLLSEAERTTVHNLI